MIDIDLYNFRVVKHTVPGVSEPYYAFRWVMQAGDSFEVCCEDESPAAHSMSELNVVMGRMKAALDMPVIDEKTGKEL